jgi:hypothetical protein
VNSLVEQFLSASLDFENTCLSKIMDFGPQQMGKWLIVAGVILALLGGLMVVLGRIGLFKLPGDLEFGSKNWRVYIPIASCILLSILLTLILWLINYFRR